MKRTLASFFASLLLLIIVHAQPTNKAARDSIWKLTVADHQLMLKQLGIKSIRPGVNGNDPNAPDAANYDETKANPFPVLPDPLKLKNGTVVTNANMWWKK